MNKLRMYNVIESKAPLLYFQVSLANLVYLSSDTENCPLNLHILIPALLSYVGDAENAGVENAAPDCRVENAGVASMESQNSCYLTPAFSTPAVWCRVFHSCVSTPAFLLLPRFPLPRFQSPPHVVGQRTS